MTGFGGWARCRGRLVHCRVVQQPRYLPRQGGGNPVIARSVATWQSWRRFGFPGTPEPLHGPLDCHGPSALAMTGFGELGALLRALGSSPRSFNNKGIRHGKPGKTPSLLGLRDVAIQRTDDRGPKTVLFAARSAGNRLSSVLRLLSSGWPSAFANDEAGRGCPRGRPLARCTVTGGRPYGDRVRIGPRAYQAVALNLTQSWEELSDDPKRFPPRHSRAGGNPTFRAFSGFPLARE
jgi:hypothetical protein